MALYQLSYTGMHPAVLAHASPAPSRAHRPHVRDERAVFTSDHVLDLVVASDRAVTLKDEDELVLAVAQRVFDVAAAAAIEAHAAEVEALIAEWGPPLNDGWEHYRHDPVWPIPELTLATRGERR